MKLAPRSLLWRTFLLLAVLMLAAVLAWVAIYAWFERAPRARMTADMLASVVNLTRTALVTGDPQRRRELLQDLVDREEIRIYVADPDERLTPLPSTPLMDMITREVRLRLGPRTRLAVGRDGTAGFFVSFTLDVDPGDDSDEFWVMLPRDRVERATRLEWVGWGGAAFVLALGGAYLLVRRLAQPLKRLSIAAQLIGGGRRPDPLPENGPQELATVARAFNQMSRDLARLDADRALILAGISHDLRTPLTRLRLGVEMSGADTFTRDGMNADIEEMDRVIGQFLDFARLDGPEQAGSAPLDLRPLLADLADSYQRRGTPLCLDISTAPPVAGRDTTLRRLVANLVDNALRYAGNEPPVELALSSADGFAVIEVRDRGPGIPAEQVERVKRPFTRLETARTGATGAGLGLAIVDRIVRLLGGRFDLLPREGGGLTVRITLPPFKAPAAMATPSPS